MTCIRVVLIIFVFTMTACSTFSSNFLDRDWDSALEIDKQDSSNLSEVIFPTALCYDEKRKTWKNYAIWANCSGLIYSGTNEKEVCDTPFKEWKSASKEYRECKDDFLDDHLLINPFHFYKK